MKTNIKRVMISAKDATILNHYQEGMAVSRVKKLLSKATLKKFRKYIT